MSKEPEVIDVEFEVITEARDWQPDYYVPPWNFWADAFPNLFAIIIVMPATVLFIEWLFHW